jgi:hypothetical protein
MSYATIDASSGNVEATVTKDNEHIKELKTQIEAACKLCEIYFDIAAQFHPGGEKGVRGDRDAIIKATTVERE